MRIRKNAKVSPVLMMYSSSSSHASAPEGALQTHVCQLNQSPWDVIPFSQYSLLTEGEDFNSCFTGNGSLGESIGAVESSVASMMDIGEDNNPAMNKGENNNVIIMDEKCARKINNNKNDNKKKAVKVANDNGMGRGNLIMGLCQKNDGKGWQCKREAKENYNFCEHHLSLFRSYNNSNSTANNNNNTIVDTTASKQKSAAATLRRTRGASAAAAAKRPSSSNSNPYEFYYYSGFGPLWARRRGERGDHGGGVGGGDSDKAEIKAAVENSNSSERSTPPLSSTTTTTLKIENNREFDYVEDEDEDEEDDVVSGDSGKKRMRKPVKARSLKSLM